MAIFNCYVSSPEGIVSCPPVLLMVGGEGLKVFGTRCGCGAGGGGSLLLSGQLQSSGGPGDASLWESRGKTNGNNGLKLVNGIQWAKTISQKNHLNLIVDS